MIELKIEGHLYRFGMGQNEAQDFRNSHESWEVKIENGTDWECSMDNSDLWCLIKESSLRRCYNPYNGDTLWTKAYRANGEPPWKPLEAQGHDVMLMNALSIDSVFRSEFINAVLFDYVKVLVRHEDVADILNKTERKEEKTMAIDKKTTQDALNEMSKMMLSSNYGTVVMARSNGKVEMIRSMLDALGATVQHPKIIRVIFNDPATIVFWSDGDKTIVKCQEGDAYSPETGIAYATMKKFLGTNATHSNYISKDIKKQVEEWYAKKEIKEDLINAVGSRKLSYEDVKKGEAK